MNISFIIKRSLFFFIISTFVMGSIFAGLPKINKIKVARHKDIFPGPKVMDPDNPDEAMRRLKEQIPSAEKILDELRKKMGIDPSNEDLIEDLFGILDKMWRMSADDILNNPNISDVMKQKMLENFEER